MSSRIASAVAAGLLVFGTGALAAAQEDECATDAECVELYAEGFVCASGSLGRYCVERDCSTDADCEEKYGDGAWCEDWGTEARCQVPDPPRYVPPFKSFCGAAAGRPGQGGGAATCLVALVLAALRRRR